MRTADLLAEHALQLRLHTPSSSASLNRPIRASAPTELLDPSPFLSADTLVLTSGIGFNFADPRTWTAYAERLAAAEVAALAFATGTAHRALPPTLVAACADLDLPLVEVPAEVPLLQVDRHVEQMLQQEHVETINRGLRLADEIARHANSGADLSTLLASLYAEVGAPLAIYDSYGSVIARFPAATSWAAESKQPHATGQTRIPLPMGLRAPCVLVVRLDTRALSLEALLGPAASVLALQLNLQQASHEHRQFQMRHLLAQCADWEEAKRNDIAQALRSIGIEFSGPVSLLLANMAGEYAATSWQLRVALHECFRLVSLAEIDGRLWAFAQQPRIETDALVQRLLSIDPDQPLALKVEAQSLEDLRLAVAQAPDVLRRTDRPRLMPELSLASMVAATAGRGARTGAQRFLQPLVEHDARRAVTLMPTLEAFLANDAQHARACHELRIHRNTLSYRLRRIQELLEVDLSTLEAQATCLLALRLCERRPRERTTQ